MDLQYQQAVLDELKMLSYEKRQSILISGGSGTGKTYVASQYAKFLNCSNFQIIEPTIGDIQDFIFACIDLYESVVVCIENIDVGSLNAANALLKLLEEPPHDVYIVVTCRNYANVLETIKSRMFHIKLNVPTDSDLIKYAKHVDNAKYEVLGNTEIWKAIKSLKDVDTIFKMPIDNVQYIESLSEIFKHRESISSSIWKLGHYPNNSRTPIDIVLQYLISVTQDKKLKHHLMQVLSEIQLQRMPEHIVLSTLFCK